MKVSAFSEYVFLHFLLYCGVGRRAFLAPGLLARVPINNECMRARGCVCARARATRTAPMCRCTCRQNFVNFVHISWMCGVECAHTRENMRTRKMTQPGILAPDQSKIACLAGTLCLHYFHRDTRTQTFRERSAFSERTPARVEARKWRAFVGGCNPRERTWIRCANLRVRDEIIITLW